jgi:glycosyl transferase family 9 (putative heptosyltransferase)
MPAPPLETLVVHPGALGDVLQAVPALGALGRLGHRLSFAGQPRIGELLEGSGLVLAATSFDTFGFEALFVENPPPPRLLSRLQRFRRVVSWFGSKDDVYRRHLGALVPESIVAAPVPDSDSPRTVWEHLVDTLGPWGVTMPTELHHLPTAERWRIAARTALMAAGADLDRPLLVAHPGAGAPWKQAPAARFARALESMAAHGGFDIVVHQGPADGRAVEALLSTLAAPVIRLVEPSLTELAGALALASAYIGSDSGVSHLAASVGTPSVILYPPETLRRWAPWSSSAVPLGVGAEGDRA